jgi:hypothetical protein
VPNDPGAFVSNALIWLAKRSRVGLDRRSAGINTEAKLLLLRQAFEVLRCVRVQFSTNELNAASRAAILRLGVTEEGVSAHEPIMPDGRKRNTMRFSIIDDEWAGIADWLEARLAAHTAENLEDQSNALGKSLPMNAAKSSL